MKLFKVKGDFLAYFQFDFKQLRCLPKIKKPVNTGFLSLFNLLFKTISIKRGRNVLTINNYYIRLILFNFVTVGL